MPKKIKPKFSGWQIFGIVASIIWALSAGTSSHNSQLRSAESYAKMAYTNCIFAKLRANNNDFSSCEQERKNKINEWLEMGGGTANDLFEAFVPIPLGWLAGFILLYVVRAQIAGFRAVIPWKTLNRKKKSFVVFCAFTSFVVILFGITSFLNSYVDTLVPVSLSPFLDIVPVPANDSMPAMVEVNGTWTRTDLKNGTIMDPLQTSRIHCYREDKKCIEATASVSGNLLMLDMTTYPIQNWTPTSITFGDDEDSDPLGGSCSSETYTIDLATKTISGAGHATNTDTNKWCKAMRLSGMNTDKDEWSLLMTNGFNVYWELRKKARPFALRLIQTLFGN